MFAKGKPIQNGEVKRHEAAYRLRLAVSRRLQYRFARRTALFAVSFRSPIVFEA